MSDPDKGWVYFALNKQVGFILLALIEDKISSRKFNKKTKNDLNVVRAMLMNSLGNEHTFYDSEEP
jgi:hypothetical protein